MTKTIHFVLILSIFCLQLSAQKPVLMVPTGHSSGVHAVSCSADGKYFLTGGGDNLVKIWNNEGRELRSFKPESAEYRQVEISPDGNRFLAAYCQTSSDAFIIDAITGNTVFTLEGQEAALCATKYTPDGQRIITADEAGIITLWNASTGKLIRRWKAFDSTSVSLCISPNGKLLATSVKGSFAKIWDAQTGVENKLLSEVLLRDSLTVLRFAPDGETACLSSAKNPYEVLFWSLTTRQITAITSGMDCVFSQDGKYVCLFKMDGAAIVPANDVQASPLQLLVAPKAPGDFPIPFYVQHGMFLPDKHSLLLYADAHPVVFDINTGIQKWQMIGYANPVQSVSFSPDGGHLLVGSNAAVVDWNLKEGVAEKRLKAHNGGVLQARYTPDGQKIVSIGNDYTAWVWDAASRDTLFHTSSNGVFPLQSYVNTLAISSDGQYFAKGHSPGWESEKPSINLWSLKDGSLKQSIMQNRDSMLSDNCDLAFSPDGRWLAVLKTDGLKLWDTRSNQWSWQMQATDHTYSAVAFTKDGNTLVTGTSSGVLQFWDIVNGKKIFDNIPNAELTGSDYTDLIWVNGQTSSGAVINDIIFSPDGKWMITTGGHKTIDIWELSSRKLVKKLTGHDNMVLSLDISPNGRWLVSASADNTVRLWDLQTSAEVARIIHLSGENWSVTTPSGLFDASPGAMEMMYFMYGNEVIELEQLKERYYEPGLLSKVLGLTTGEVRKVEMLKALELFPEVDAQIVQNQLKINLTPRNGGIGKISLLINGTERGPEDCNPGRKNSLSIDLNDFEPFYLRDTINVISIRAYNADGWLKSQPHKINYAYSNKKGNGQTGETPVLGDAKPRLFGILVGTADYSGEKMDLKYADQDASAMAQAVEASGKVLFADEVHLELFHTGVLTENSSNTTAQVSTKANIQKAFQDLARPGHVTANDVLWLYFSGHGVTYGEAEKAQFYYLTKDIASEDLSDPEVRANFTISSEELTQWIKNIPALKKVLIMDACNSGKIVESLTSIGQKDLNPSQVRAFDRMKDRVGMFILTGSAADKVSYEASQYGQGLLTYSLLEGMSRADVRRSDIYVDVMKLFQHARDKVPELARTINGIQTPTLAFPLDGGSFDIGIVNDKVKIPLAQQKPVFVRNNFQDEDAFEDVLGLTEALEQYFLTQMTKGAQSRIVYWDVKEYENAFSMKGRYSIKGSDVEVRFKLFKGKSVLGEEIKVTGKKEDVPGLVKEILKVVMPMAK